MSIIERFLARFRRRTAADFPEGSRVRHPDLLEDGEGIVVWTDADVDRVCWTDRRGVTHVTPPRYRERLP